jgi:hypothetical protein
MVEKILNPSQEIGQFLLKKTNQSAKIAYG